MKAKCINAGPHHQYELGKIYDYSVMCGVCDIKGAMSVSEKNFPVFFEKIEENGQTETERHSLSQDGENLG